MPYTVVGLKIVAFGKLSKTSCSALNLVLRSRDGLSILAPAAENYINLTTLGFLAHAFAILRE